MLENHIQASVLAFSFKDLLNLYEEEFVGGDVSWTTDFVQQQMTVEFSRAYFRSVDVYFESNVQPYLNFEDMDNLVAICERHSGSGGE